MSTPPAAPDHTRAEARRQQILCAAAQCFREHGFHGASIAQISRAAGMSAGHIYHYFDNKESIIAAIVAQDLENLLTLTARLRAAPDIHRAMIDHVVEGVSQQLEPVSATLKLEIVAEAARNPRIAEIVGDADLACRNSLTQTLRASRLAAGHDDDPATLEGLVETVATLFDGMIIRAIRNPDLNRDQLIRNVQAILSRLIKTGL